MKKKFKHLIIIGHPDKKSFCYNGIFKTIIKQLKESNENYKTIDLYEDKLHRNRTELIKAINDSKKLYTQNWQKQLEMEFDIDSTYEEIEGND